MAIINIFYGLLMIGVGVVLLKFNYQVVNTVGRQDWIESKLGSGSTYLAFKLLAVALVLLGILVATGLGKPFFEWLLSPLQRLFNPEV